MKQRKGLRRSISIICNVSIDDISLVAPEVKQLSIRSQSKALVSMRHQSSIFYSSPDAMEDGEQFMYDYGTNTLINDRVHVYKGGSWTDREYWLNPGTRRYLNHDLTAYNIGFRCVLDRMGSSIEMGNSDKRRRKQFSRKISRY